MIHPLQPNRESIYSMPDSASGSTADGKVEAAASLYKDCLAYFTALSQSDSLSSDLKERKLFKRELGRLYLWGEDLQDGKLQVVLRRSTDLRNTVLRLLVALGKALVKSNVESKQGPNQLANFESV